MSSVEPRGQFVWHELMTTDTAGASAFYPRVAGWKSQAWGKDSAYTLWVGHAGPLGGLMRKPEEADAAPSQWMPYISTADVDATIEAARKLGASVHKEAFDVPDAGRIAILLDPQGATFAIIKPMPPQGSAAGAPPGASDFSWHELATTDAQAALRFYSQLFGWGTGPNHDMGEMGYYQIFKLGGKASGGIYKLQPGVTMPHWLSYVRVDDVNKAANAAQAAGGRVVNGPMEVPGGDWIAQIIDPQGAAFAVHQIKQSAKSAQAKATAPKKAKARSRRATADAAPAKVAKPAQRASARRPTAKRKSAAAKKSAAARKRASSRRVAAGSRARIAKRATTVKRASSAARRRPAVRKHVAAKKKRGTRRLRAKRRR